MRKNKKLIKTLTTGSGAAFASQMMKLRNSNQMSTEKSTKAFAIDKIFEGRSNSIANPIKSRMLKSKKDKNLFISKQKVSTDRFSAATLDIHYGTHSCSSQFANKYIQFKQKQKLQQAQQKEFIKNYNDVIYGR